MKIFIRAMFGVAAVFVFALAYQTPMQAQNRIEDRFANVAADYSCIEYKL
jgi:hypothetical protein